MVTLTFDPANAESVLGGIPAAPAVFLLASREGEPYVSKSANLRRRLQRLLGPADERTKKLNLRERVTRIEYTLTGSEFESAVALYRLLRQTFPKSYRDRLKLRPAPLVRLNLDNPWPRAYVTTRLGSLKGRSIYYGPFATRAAAEKFLNDSLDFFKMRRCDFDLNPDPAFPGCIYSEMQMCLAPCFKGCTDDQYRSEVVRVQEFLDSGGGSLRRELEEEREQASAELEFERAAGIHVRLEKVAAAAALCPELARRMDRLSGVIVQRAAEPEHVALFRLARGQIAEPVLFPVGVQTPQAHGKPLSMEARLSEALAAAPAPDGISAAELTEHLALLKRWYYRSRRTGEIFLADDKGELPMRRLVRGVGRVFRGEEEPEFTAETRGHGEVQS